MIVIVILSFFQVKPDDARIKRYMKVGKGEGGLVIDIWDRGLDKDVLQKVVWFWESSYCSFRVGLAGEWVI